MEEILTQDIMFFMGFIWLIVVLSIWESVWKAIAMWKSARNNQLAWFICILIFNTIGILPILYIFVFQPKKVEKKKIEVKNKKQNKTKKTKHL
ncbi:MAG: DUF5652 family protein [Candidatus Woesearchaeota archaeon]